jgi:hypothetical protein
VVDIGHVPIAAGSMGLEAGWMLITAVDYDASCEPNSRRHHQLNLVV